MLRISMETLFEAARSKEGRRTRFVEDIEIGYADLEKAYMNVYGEEMVGDNKVLLLGLVREEIRGLLDSMEG